MSSQGGEIKRLTSYQQYAIQYIAPRKEVRRRNMLKELVLYLGRLARERFYGTVELKFEAGRVVFVRVNRTLKLEDLAAGDKT